jgi:phosphoribosylaminoimidazolecarboxamide formyltransferase/IMP cyclohydrolase
VTARIAVGVSGAGSNLRALVAAGARGELGGEVALVFADRDCTALGWAAGQGIATALVARGRDKELVATLSGAAIDLVVLAGYMRIVRKRTLRAFEGRIVNTHPSLLPAFPGAHAVRDALAQGARVTGVTVHHVDATLDGGPIIAQEAIAIMPGDDETILHARIKAVEHRLLPAVVARLLAGQAEPESEPPPPRRALLSVSDKTGLVDFARALTQHRFELVSTGGTARTLRDAGLPVTEVSSVTGFPEMLDGRVKTLHPRIHAGILADRRRPEHRRALVDAAIAPFDIVCVNLYPFAAAAERPGISLDELVEEIDIGGPSMVRAAAKNHASVAIVTDPARYGDVLAALDAHGSVPIGLRSALAAEAFRHTAAYDARIATELPVAMAGAGVPLPDWPGLPGASDPFPPDLVVGLEKVETLRYGENPHQPAARYRRAGPDGEMGPFTDGGAVLQGKQLSYNNVLDATAAANLAAGLRGPACVIVKHTNPCGAAERPTLLESWQSALAADPVSAFGGVVGLTGIVDRDTAQAMTAVFLEVVVAPGYDEEARAILATKENLRLLVDERLDGSRGRDRPTPGRTASIRTTGGAVLVGAPDSLPDDPTTWRTVSILPPTDLQQHDLELAWQLARGVVSNAIVLVRDGMLIGIGSGQTSRVDAARQAVEKARTMLGPEVLVGAACASDAFFPFPDAVAACLAAGVGAFVQPGGSLRDADAIAAVNAAGATMVVTGTRHFRH